MSTYPVSDFLIQIKNAYLAHKDSVFVPTSKMKLALAKVLKKEGYIAHFELKKEKHTRQSLVINLMYQNNKPKVTDVLIVSKPGKRVYAGKDNIPKVLGNLGIAILSTSEGIMTNKEAVKKGLGGEVICKIW